jgi:peptidyl-prolyl cis-trans isomerase C
MTRIGLVAASVLVLGLAACSNKAKIENVDVGSIAQEPLTKADFEAYLQVKKIPNEPGSRLERAQKTYLERNALAQAISNEPLLDKKLVEAELRDFRNELLITRYFEKYLASSASEADVKKYYDQNADKFRQRKAQLADIVLKLTPTASEQEKSAQFKKAVEIFNKAKTGAAFATLAAQNSDDSASATKGGDIGWVQESEMEKPFADKVFSMKKGDISEPISTTTGYHIVQLLADPVEETKGMSDQEDGIKYRMRFEAKNKETERLLGKVTVKELK